MPAAGHRPQPDQRAEHDLVQKRFADAHVSCGRAAEKTRHQDRAQNSGARDYIDDNASELDDPEAKRKVCVRPVHDKPPHPGLTSMLYVVVVNPFGPIVSIVLPPCSSKVTVVRASKVSVFMVTSVLLCAQPDDIDYRLICLRCSFFRSAISRILLRP